MNKTQITKFSDSSRCQTMRKPFLAITSSNFFNISDNNESKLNTDRHQNQFVSLFGDDYIQYGKNIFTEKGQSVKKEKIDKIWKKKNKLKKNENHNLNNINRNFRNFSKTKTFIDNNSKTNTNRENHIENFRKKLQSSSDKKEYKNVGFKRGNTFDRKFVRVMVI